MALWGNMVSGSPGTSETIKEFGERAEEVSWGVPSKNVGIDLGYGFVKLIDGDNSLRFPSVVGAGKQLAFQSDFQVDNDPLEQLFISIDRKDYFVGKLAIRQSNVASRSLDQNRVTDVNSKILMLTALSLLNQWDKQVFNLVTGLPANYFAAYKNEWSSSLMGQYTVEFGDGSNLKRKSFSVNAVKIVPQPFGTLYDQMLNQYGKATNKEFADMRIGVVDIGFKTADFAVSDQLEYIEHLSFSTNTALSNAYKIIGERLRREYKLDKEDYELDRIIERNTVRVAGKSHDISRIKSEAYEVVADKIITELDSHWDYKEFDLIFVTGGGGEALSQFLLPRFTNMVLVENAQHANARGFHKLAQSSFTAK